MSFPRHTRTLLASLIAGATLGALLVAPGAQAAARHVDGTVVSKNAAARTFRLATQSGTVTVKVNAGTDFERISGFGGLRKGLAVEVDAVRVNGVLVASQVETRGGGGGGDDHGGDDHGGHGGGGDDGPNHT